MTQVHLCQRLRIAVPYWICQVQFLSQIDMALKAGAVAVVQGTEAGGHGAPRSTFPFVPEAADYLKQHSPETLLLAARGVADGRGLAAALMLGGNGVVVGSRFWASAEAQTPKVHEFYLHRITSEQGLEGPVPISAVSAFYQGSFVRSQSEINIRPGPSSRHARIDIWVV